MHLGRYKMLLIVHASIHSRVHICPFCPLEVIFAPCNNFGRYRISLIVHSSIHLRVKNCPFVPWRCISAPCNRKVQNYSYSALKYSFEGANLSSHLQTSCSWCIPGGPEITEQSIQSIFQNFALINSYFLHLVG